MLRSIPVEKAGEDELRPWPGPNKATDTAATAETVVDRTRRLGPDVDEKLGPVIMSCPDGIAIGCKQWLTCGQS